MSRFIFRALGFLMIVAGGMLTMRLNAQDRPATPQNPKAPAMNSEFQLSSPFNHENLTIFLIHGPDKLKDKKFLTLQEALEQKKVVVHETSNVNQLTVENLSPNEEIFIQAGEIVKGGKQDRLLSIDLIVSAHSGQVPIAAFCVEHGRWVKRGNEEGTSFARSSDIAASNSLRLARTYKKAHWQDWKEVSED